MNSDQQISVRRVATESDRRLALAVMRVIYRDEKQWARDDEKLVAKADIESDAVSWFVAFRGSVPVGVLRALYEPPMDMYKSYGFELRTRGFDLEGFIRTNRIAEIGRFAILPGLRKNIRVAMALISAAVRDTVERDFTHYITDVFEGEQHSPYGFHSRVIGFEVVASHEKGELNCACRRLTMALDIRRAYGRLRATNNWVFRALTSGWPEHLHRRMADGEGGRKEALAACAAVAPA